VTSWLARQLETLGRPVERDHRQSDAAFRRRRVVVALTLVVGAALLALSLSTAPGDPRFYALTLALAATWTVGALLSGPLHAGRVHDGSGLRRPVLQPVGIGLVLVAVFVVGALLVGQVPALEGSVNRVLAHARQGALPLIVLVTVVNGVAEELFFRGALYAAVGIRRPVAVSTAAYAATTVVTGNVMLVFAAVVVGVLVGLQRRASGGVLAPALTHVTWSLGMLLLLPPIMGAVV
jgi:membrane protease YdiL (CAAX protease family)